MKEHLEKRLSKLKAEFESGQKVLSDLEAKQTSIRETMLRIAGAIQVLEEELSKAKSEENGKPPEEVELSAINTEK